MKILRTYILKQLFVPFLLSFAVLTSVFLLGNLIKLTDLVINKGVSLSTIGELFLLTIPVLMGYTLPIACLIAVILAFSRLSADNEILAMRASGIHLMRLLMPLLVIGILFSLFSVILNERIIPYAYYRQHKMIKTLGAENPAALLEAGVFIKAFEGQILFIHKIEDNKMQNVTIYQPQANGPTRTIIARQGEFTPIPGENQIKLKLVDGTSDEPNLQDPTKFYKLNFKNYFMTLDMSEKAEKIEKKPQGMSLEELQAEIKNLQGLITDNEQLAQDITRLETEYYRKITWSLAPFAFIFLGFPIAVITNKRQKSANVVLAILCAAGYYLISLGCKALAVESIAAPGIIMWVPNALALISASYLNYKCVS